MSVHVIIAAPLAFAPYVTCPRMTAMVATQTKVSGLDPTLMISLGCVLGIPMFIMLFLILKCFGVEAAVLSAAALDVAALLIGKLNLKAGIKLAVIAVFVYVGIRVAPLISNLLTQA